MIMSWRSEMLVASLGVYLLRVTIIPMLTTEIKLIISGIGFAIEKGCAQVITPVGSVIQVFALLSLRFIFSEVVFLGSFL
jgi:hypothetical protein